MSYSVTGVAAISFPIPALQNDAYSVPGSHRDLASLPSDTQYGVGTAVSTGKVATQIDTAQANAKIGQAKSASPVDTVTLSTAQKVLKLQREGESALQIAATLNLPTKEVQNDLHIATSARQSFTVAPVTAPLSGNTTATVSVPTAGA